MRKNAVKMQREKARERETDRWTYVVTKGERSRQKFQKCKKETHILTFTCVVHVMKNRDKEKEIVRGNDRERIKMRHSKNNEQSNDNLYTNGILSLYAYNNFPYICNFRSVDIKLCLKF